MLECMSAHTHMYGALRVQKGLSHPPELELQTCEAPCAFWELNPGPLD